VREGRIFVTAAEIPHEQVNLAAIRDMNCRARMEKQLEAALGVPGVIIDVPEPVSFETGLYVVDEKCGFSESSSAFKTETVNAFIQTLYTIRIFIDRKYKDTIKTFSKVCDILNDVIIREV